MYKVSHLHIRLKKYSFALYKLSQESSESGHNALAYQQTDKTLKKRGKLYLGISESPIDVPPMMQGYQLVRTLQCFSIFWT